MNYPLFNVGRFIGFGFVASVGQNFSFMQGMDVWGDPFGMIDKVKEDFFGLVGDFFLEKSIQKETRLSAETLDNTIEMISRVQRQRQVTLTFDKNGAGFELGFNGGKGMTFTYFQTCGTEGARPVSNRGFVSGGCIHIFSEDSQRLFTPVRDGAIVLSKFC
jgi:hypothetical protein